jgi:peptide/nickel transport system permease protein
MELAVEKRRHLSDFKRDINRERRRLFVRRFLSNKLTVTGSIIILLTLLLTLIGPIITSYNPYEMVVTSRLKAPSSAHLFGTDNLGRDLFTRVVYGARASMGVGLSVAIITSILGMIVGLYSSYYKVLDHVLMRICDGLMAFPAILLAISLMAALGTNIENVIIALSVVYSPYVARVVRSAALVVREQTYIEAMKAQGATSQRIIWKHIAPNTLSPLIVYSTFIFADAIIIEAGLSFLGVGVPAPDPSWGNILYDGKLVIFNSWWMTFFPGFAIIMSVLGLNLFGDGLRDLLDPHTNRAKK